MWLVLWMLHDLTYKLCKNTINPCNCQSFKSTSHETRQRDRHKCHINYRGSRKISIPLMNTQVRENHSANLKVWVLWRLRLTRLAWCRRPRSRVAWVSDLQRWSYTRNRSDDGAIHRHYLRQYVIHCSVVIFRKEDRWSTHVLMEGITRHEEGSRFTKYQRWSVLTEERWQSSKESRMLWSRHTSTTERLTYVASRALRCLPTITTCCQYALLWLVIHGLMPCADIRSSVAGYPFLCIRHNP